MGDIFVLCLRLFAIHSSAAKKVFLFEHGVG